MANKYTLRDQDTPQLRATRNHMHLFRMAKEIGDTDSAAWHNAMMNIAFRNHNIIATGRRAMISI